MNKVMLIGNAGRDPEMTYAPSGSAVSKFTLAVSRKWTDKATNEKKEETIWFRIIAWDRLAETIQQYVHKGTKLFIEGRLALPHEYQDREGKTRFALEVIASNIELLDPKGGGASGSDSGGSYASGGRQQSSAAGPAVSGDDPDFPF